MWRNWAREGLLGRGVLGEEAGCVVVRRSFWWKRASVWLKKKGSGSLFLLERFLCSLEVRESGTLRKKVCVFIVIVSTLFD